MTSTLLILGAGPGISQATAQRFGREGWRIVLASRRPDRLAASVAELTAAGVTAEAQTVDVSEGASVRDLVARIDRDAERLDAIHFNAAVVRQGSLFGMTDQEIAGDLLTDIGGALHAIRAAREVFRDRGGAVLLTGGGLALHPHPEFVTLGIGKAGVRHVAEALHATLAAEGVHLATVTVNQKIAPGSADAVGVADRLWALQAEPRAGWTWEATYP